VGLPGTVWQSRAPLYFADVVCSCSRANGGSSSVPSLLRLADAESCDVRSVLLQPFLRGVLEVGTVRRSAQLRAATEAQIWSLVRAHADRARAADCAAADGGGGERRGASADAAGELSNAPPTLRHTRSHSGRTHESGAGRTLEPGRTLDGP
jgi:hypothetical protein